MADPNMKPGLALGSTADPGSRLDPSSVSLDYEAQASFWKLVDDILGGKPTMQAAGELYLPRFQEEKQGSRDSNQRIYDPYARRLLLAPFTNIFEDILRNLASKPFSRELTLKEDTPKPYLDLAEDIDAQGSSFHVFGHRVFKDALAHNTAWILVDFTKATPSESGQPLTKADERAQGLRPYWIHIEAPRMLAAYSDFIDGVEIITILKALARCGTLYARGSLSLPDILRPPGSLTISGTLGLHGSLSLLGTLTTIGSLLHYGTLSATGSLFISGTLWLIGSLPYCGILRSLG
jgi:hypothetical protein